MLPITRVNLQNFCRACLCELSTAKEPCHNISGVCFNNILPQNICNSCHLKVNALKEFRRKAIFSTGILRLIFDDNKSVTNTEASLQRLSKYCRVCLRRPSNERYNIRNSTELFSSMSACIGIQIIGSQEYEAKDALKDDLRFPDALCNRCYAALKSYMQFQTVSKQTADYLNNVLNENENLDITKNEEVDIEKERLDLEALELTELLPVTESSQLEPLFSASDNDVLNALELETYEDVPHVPQTAYLEKTEIVLTENVNSSEFSDTETLSDKFDYQFKKQNTSVGDNKPTPSRIKTLIKKQRVPQKLQSNLRCHKCNKSFRKQFLYQAHMKSVHEGIKNAFTCSHCSLSFANMKILQRHINSSHKISNQKANYLCTYCERSFKRNVRLKEHISTVHQKLKPFKCGVCSKTFGTKNTLVRHEKNHSSDKPFSCEYCGKRYNSKSDLNVHIQRHTTNPELLCPICKRAQKDQEELKKHIDRHSKVYQCTECGKIFQKMVNLREHVDTVHLKQKFYCQFCNLAFSARKSLKNHELSHNSTNWPEVCAECKLYFKSKHSLLIHMKKSHAKLLQPKCKAEQPEKCSICFCRFETKDSLQHHMEKLHAFDSKNVKLQVVKEK